MIDVRRTPSSSRGSATCAMPALVIGSPSASPAGYGLLGDAKFFDGIRETRVDHGPGYRVHFVRPGETLITLLCGGDKRSQKRDIKRAKAWQQGIDR